MIGIFRFPFRFEGKKRLQTAIAQYHLMKEICDATTYLHSDGMMDILKPGTTISEANQIFESIEEAPIRAIEEMIRVPGDMNIDVHDLHSFMKSVRGPVYIRTFEGDTFDEPLKYTISAPYLPQDYVEGNQMIVNIGCTKNVDMASFQQINLRLNDLFHKADLFKLGTYMIDEPGHRFKITLILNGMKDPYPRPEHMQKFSVPRHWIKGKWEWIAKISRSGWSLPIQFKRGSAADHKVHGDMF